MLSGQFGVPEIINHHREAVNGPRSDVHASVHTQIYLPERCRRHHFTLHTEPADERYLGNGDVIDPAEPCVFRWTKTSSSLRPFTQLLKFENQGQDI